jgi:phage shock protein E
LNSVSAFNMEWLWVILIVVFAAGWFALTRASFVPAGEALRLLASGAVVIDVRTAGEFAKGHLPQALNIPLSEVRDQIVRQVPDKSRAILVHCHAGGRSEIAKRQLKAMGYVNVHNLGSLARAQQIVSSAS